MATLTQNLTALIDTRIAIRDAIEAKGVSVPPGSTFDDYAALILLIGQTMVMENITAGADVVTVDGEPVWILVMPGGS